MKIFVDIKEIWSATVTVEVPENATRDEMLEAATTAFEENGTDTSEYDRTMERDHWTVRKENGDYV